MSDAKPASIELLIMSRDRTIAIFRERVQTYLKMPTYQTVFGWRPWDYAGADKIDQLILEEFGSIILQRSPRQKDATFRLDLVEHFRNLVV